jgi:hypothetical protein
VGTILEKLKSSTILTSRELDHLQENCQVGPFILSKSITPLYEYIFRIFYIAASHLWVFQV